MDGKPKGNDRSDTFMIKISRNERIVHLGQDRHKRGSDEGADPVKYLLDFARELPNEGEYLLVAIEGI